MKEIPLTKGMVAIVDNQDYEWLSQWSWCFLSVGYAVRGERRNGKNHMILMHREIVQQMGVNLASSHYVDHINSHRLDNRRANLRPASPTQSAYHTVKSNKTGYRGVLYVPFCWRGSTQYMRRKPWQARIRSEGRKQRSLGYYVTAEQAATAYDTAARTVHGEFAVLNFPEVNDERNS